MTVLLFRPRFVEPIQGGTKHQTIRATPRCKPEDVLSLRVWAGLPYRSEQQEIVPPVVCEAIRPITIRIDRWDNRAEIAIGGQALTHDEVCRFVRADGFRCVSDFVEHWHARDAMHFEGFLIEWADRPGGAS
jgi:hypothetical protein